MTRIRVDLITIFVLAISILAFPAPPRCQPFLDPGIPDGQTVHYSYRTGGYPNDFLIEVKQGEEVVKSTSRVQIVSRSEGNKIYRVQDTGVRRNGYQFEQVSEIRAEPEFKPLGFTTKDRNPEGRIIREMGAAFDDPTLSYPPGTFPVFGLVQVMRGTPFQQGKRAVFYLWLAPTEIVRMRLEVVRQEKIQVPAGEFVCYLAEMKPDIRSIIPVGGLLSKLLQPFIPKYHLWFACDHAHPMVKFEGVLGGTGAAKHTIELERIEEPGRP